MYCNCTRETHHLLNPPLWTPEARDHEHLQRQIQVDPNFVLLFNDAKQEVFMLLLLWLLLLLLSLLMISIFNINTHVNTSKSLSLSISLSLYLYIYICICTYVYIHTHSYTCTRTSIQVLKDVKAVSPRTASDLLWPSPDKTN